ncbi:hypothetical protein KC887_00710 [Candidatus Kaiserbacteria bacterium]|nr:hypothetical protein [Candidatus Kaiserbacteria bacterium]
MAWVLECKNGDQQSFACCYGGTGSELFTGLQVTDDDGGITKLYSPFEVHYSILQNFVYVSDYKGNRKRIDLSNTSFPSLAALVQFISGCQACSCSGGGFAGAQSCYHQAFINASGTSVAVTVTQLPLNAEDYPYIVEVTRDGGKAIFGVHYTASPVTNRIIFDRALEGEDVEVIICTRKDWVYENFINYSGSSLQVTIARIGTATSEWLHQEFINVSGNEVTLTAGTLPTLDVNLNLRVYRDGGKGIYGEHFTIDDVNNKIIFAGAGGIGDPRTLEGENVQVFWRETDVEKVLRVFRDGGKGIYGQDFLIDTANNSIVPVRSYENENIQVYLRAN